MAICFQSLYVHVTGNGDADMKHFASFRDHMGKLHRH